LKDLLEIVSLEVMTKSVGARTHSKNWRARVQILGAATLKLRAPNEVRINGTERDWYLTT